MNMIHDGSSVLPILIPTASSLKSYNFYLVEQEGTLLLIDAGIDSESCWEAFLNTLTAHGFSVEDISMILLTHNHHDHVGLVNRITKLKEAPVYAHPEAYLRLKRDQEFFSMRTQFFAELYREMGCGEAGERQVQRLREAVSKNEKQQIQADILALPLGQFIAGLIVLETPGHSPDHVSFHDAKRNWLFSGDHILGHISSNAIVEPNREGQRLFTLEQYLQSLEKCLHVDYDIAFPGHGDLLYEPKQLVKQRILRIHEKAEKFLKLIKQGVRSANELAQQVYRHKYQSDFSLVMSEIIGHLDYLEVRQKIQKEKKNGVWEYSPLN
ncbi:MBL fold metallo-hydrolase [Ammoniphilus sp. YIM 78166]|uniref:MBL fold metallo-hydrolase n=1 Tax=Ammoniphilus sp. YIM 78166 TaxID=1644106 RepID=UPI00106FDBEC|nr:MBL fold metallo-hydrolase [Ammoniphilus sp. YIM 78166]